MQLHNITPPKGAVSKPLRVGRGRGSGRGKTAGRGVKGQTSRTGHMATAGFEGGQMPLQRRIPKRGFVNPFRQVSTIVNIKDLERKFDSGAVVDLAALCEKGLVSRSASKVKILAKGKLSKKLSVKVHAFSEGAKKEIERAGGTVEIITSR